MKPLISPAGKPSAQSGVTLLEMLVVVSILGLVVAALPLRNFTALGTVELKALAQDMAADLRQSRMRAALEGQPSDLAIDVSRRRYGNDKLIPEDVAVSFRTTQEEQLSPAIGRVRFMPDGSSNGGRIELSRGGRAMAVTVHWLTGQVSVVDGGSRG